MVSCAPQSAVIIQINKTYEQCRVSISSGRTLGLIRVWGFCLSWNIHKEDVDMNGDQNDNQLRDEDLISELRNRLEDLSDLPPDHDLIRWIHATSVIWKSLNNTKWKLYLQIQRETLRQLRPCTGRVCSGGQSGGWMSCCLGGPPPSSRNTIPGGWRATTRTTAQCGSFHSARQMLKAKLNFLFLFK